MGVVWCKNLFFLLFIFRKIFLWQWKKNKKNKKCEKEKKYLFGLGCFLMFFFWGLGLGSGIFFSLHKKPKCCQPNFPAYWCPRFSITETTVCMLQLYLWYIIYAIVISIKLVYEILPPLFPVHFVNRFYLLNNSESNIFEWMSW